MDAASRLRLHIRRAGPDDLDAIVALEQQCFSDPWSPEMLRAELGPRGDRMYLLAELDGELAGYVGMWFFAQEAHIGTVAVSPRWRRRGIAEILLIVLLTEAAARGGRYAALEYRVSNEAAARLYEKLGFVTTRIRRRYYTDNNEDAVETAMEDLGARERHRALNLLAIQWLKRHQHDLSFDLRQSGSGD